MSVHWALSPSRVFAAFSVFLTFGVAACHAAAPADAGRLTLTTQRAVVFKDGYALLIKHAAGVANASGEVYTTETPDSAVLGSFWATSDNGRTLAMRAEYTDDWRRAERPDVGAKSALSGLISHATGKHIELTRVDGAVVSGTLAAKTTVDGKTLVLVQTQDADPVPVALSDIVAIRGPASAGNEEADASFMRAKRLSFDFGVEHAGKPVELTLMYFTPGVRWIPTYRVSGELKTSASMELQAEILNDSEDLENVTLDLVVGVPHFRFRNVVSPLSLEAMLRNTLVETAPQLMGQMSNALFTQRAGEWRQAPESPAATTSVDLPEELQATGEHDLFVYSAPSFSLTAGGRATIPLWRAEAPMREVFTLDLNVIRNGRHGSVVSRSIDDYQRVVESPLRLLKKQVWRQIELTNASKTPWTTGAAMILSNGLPLGQDLLTYTSPGGATLLPVTVAVDVSGALSEEEVERKPNALKRDDHSYTLIRKKGVVTLTNSRAEKCVMRVTLSLPGKVSDASAGGRTRIDDHHAEDWSESSFWQNNHSDVTWNRELKPGETVELTYFVSFYVR